MTESSTEHKQDKNAKFPFVLTGFTQTGGIRSYAFEGRICGRRVDYTVAVDLALIPGYGIRIQDLPLLCRELLQQRAEPDQISAMVFTEQHMRSHAEKLTVARQEAAHRKKAPHPPAAVNPATGGRTPFR